MHASFHSISIPPFVTFSCKHYACCHAPPKNVWKIALTVFLKRPMTHVRLSNFDFQLLLLGSSMRSLPPQYSRFHSGQGIQSEKPAHHSPIGQVNFGPPDVWQKPQEGQRHGAANSQQTSSQRICLQGRRRIPWVSKKKDPTTSDAWRPTRKF